MTQISLSDLKVNPGKYVSMAQEQEIMITRNGKIIAKIVPAKQDKKAAWEQIKSVIGAPEVQMTDAEIDTAKEERILG
ncbi:type II toxin-antitoxin system prevent-host-death family antitoxin [Pseudoflavonifractor phocaeensis]|nr:type II toxin-antitoxin system prevent-host-death family antitoxin [Pseudoflavonifractor phocaeensis]